ncbi:uncharacterized protein LOC143427207 [Xylocopa sonorina]|uniref:uncharacterized protein LOC143427207 n=1 Tax=Xylocopa sonorina TaxID=1818115 RepID=UPI00403ABDDD
MVPLSWALTRTLKSKPSDPIHFTAYQLLRWVHGNISQTKKDTLHQLIALSTIAMDQKLIMKKHSEKEKLSKKLNEETMRNTPCNICNHQEICHIKNNVENV